MPRRRPKRDLLIDVGPDHPGCQMSKYVSYSSLRNRRMATRGGKYMTRISPESSQCRWGMISLDSLHHWAWIIRGFITRDDPPPPSSTANGHFWRTTYKRARLLPPQIYLLEKRRTLYLLHCCWASIAWISLSSQPNHAKLWEPTKQGLIYLSTKEISFPPSFSFVVLEP
jgi:hypothetical protein